MDNPLISLSLLAILAFEYFYLLKRLYTVFVYNKLKKALTNYTVDNNITDEKYYEMLNQIDYSGNFLKWLIDWDISNCTTRENWDKLKPYL